MSEFVKIDYILVFRASECLSKYPAYKTQRQTRDVKLFQRQITLSCNHIFRIYDDNSNALRFVMLLLCTQKVILVE